MRKGEATRQTILDRAGQLASQFGLEGVTIGRLADELRLSKSGLFAHFRSKEELQIQVLDYERARFVDMVVTPTLATAGGEPRVRELFERWNAWRESLPGGCVFVGASFELDDRPGPVRDKVAELQRQWLDSIARVAESAIKRGHFHAGVDPRMFAHELYGLMLSGHLSSRLLDDAEAPERTRRAFENLMARSRTHAAAA